VYSLDPLAPNQERSFGLRGSSPLAVISWWSILEPQHLESGSECDTVSRTSVRVDTCVRHSVVSSEDAERPVVPVVLTHESLRLRHHSVHGRELEEVLSAE
jgi:hypothetical protein